MTESPIIIRKEATQGFLDELNHSHNNPKFLPDKSRGEDRRILTSPNTSLIPPRSLQQEISILSGSGSGLIISRTSLQNGKSPHRPSPQAKSPFHDLLAKDPQRTPSHNENSQQIFQPTLLLSEQDTFINLMNTITQTKRTCKDFCDKVQAKEA
ncbi:hypothetical protein NHQ30_008643 [Ciborinia camelliae]|nr:hypothetical protein NHQ30_008643 [Ciborinia camelliae]